MKPIEKIDSFILRILSKVLPYSLLPTYISLGIFFGFFLSIEFYICKINLLLGYFFAIGLATLMWLLIKVLRDDPETRQLFNLERNRKKRSKMPFGSYHC